MPSIFITVFERLSIYQFRRKSEYGRQEKVLKTPAFGAMHSHSEKGAILPIRTELKFSRMLMFLTAHHVSPADGSLCLLAHSLSHEKPRSLVRSNSMDNIGAKIGNNGPQPMRRSRSNSLASTQTGSSRQALDLGQKRPQRGPELASPVRRDSKLLGSELVSSPVDMAGPGLVAATRDSDSILPSPAAGAPVPSANPIHQAQPIVLVSEGMRPTTQTSDAEVAVPSPVSEENLLESKDTADSGSAPTAANNLPVSAEPATAVSGEAANQTPAPITPSIPVSSLPVNATPIPSAVAIVQPPNESAAQSMPFKGARNTVGRKSSKLFGGSGNRTSWLGRPGKPPK